VIEKYTNLEIDKFDSYNKIQTSFCNILIKQVMVRNETRTHKLIDLTAAIKMKLKLACAKYLSSR
jgi:hypothetical protein